MRPTHSSGTSAAVTPGRRGRRSADRTVWARKLSHAAPPGRFRSGRRDGLEDERVQRARRRSLNAFRLTAPICGGRRRNASSQALPRFSSPHRSACLRRSLRSPWMRAPDQRRTPPRSCLGRPRRLPGVSSTMDDRDAAVQPSSKPPHQGGNGSLAHFASTTATSSRGGGAHGCRSIGWSLTVPPQMLALSPVNQVTRAAGPCCGCGSSTVGGSHTSNVAGNGGHVSVEFSQQHRARNKLARAGGDRGREPQISQTTPGRPATARAPRTRGRGRSATRRVRRAAR